MTESVVPTSCRVQLRPALNDIPAYSPGRPIFSAAASKTFKVSANENPYPPLPWTAAAAEQSLTTINRYPDMYANDLTDALADYFDVPPSSVAVGPGSVGILSQIFVATCETAHQVIFPWRSFEAYPILVQVAGGTPRPMPLLPNDGHDLAAMLAAITSYTRVMLLCIPNNPTGASISVNDLLEFLAAVPMHVLVVLDQAYAEYSSLTVTKDIPALIARFPHLVILRTFSKAYGLAGLRVGYALGHPQVITALEQVAIPFAVSNVAQAAAVAALAATSQMQQQVDQIVRERVRVVTDLRRQGWVITQPEGNFIWFPVGVRGEEFAASCHRAGLSVRTFPEGVRVTVAEAQANDLLISTAQRFLEA